MDCSYNAPMTIKLYVYEASTCGERLVRRTLEALPEGKPLWESEIGEMIDTVYDEAQLKDFLDAAHKKRDVLRQLVDTLTPGKEEPREEDDLLDELIDSIAIVPNGFREQHQALLTEGQYFDAQDFVMNISLTQFTYAAGARLQGWPVEEFALQVERPPRPREQPQEASELAGSKATNPNASDVSG